MVDHFMDLSLDKILLKCRVPGVSYREVIGPIRVKDQPPLNSNNSWVNAAGAGRVIVERGDVVVPAPGLAWAPVVADEHAVS